MVAMAWRKPPTNPLLVATAWGFLPIMLMGHRLLKATVVCPEGTARLWILQRRKVMARRAAPQGYGPPRRAPGYSAIQALPRRGPSGAQPGLWSR